MTAATADMPFDDAGQGREPAQKPQKPARGRAPVRSPGRFTKADERAFGKLLAEADDPPVTRLMMAIGRYEVTVENARARLTRRIAFTPGERSWMGGYVAAMGSILQLVAGMLESTENPARILAAVIETTAGVSEMHYADSPDYCWPEAQS